MTDPKGPDPGRKRRPGMTKAPHPIMAPKARAHIARGDMLFSSVGLSTAWFSAMGISPYVKNFSLCVVCRISLVIVVSCMRSGIADRRSSACSGKFVSVLFPGVRRWAILRTQFCQDASQSGKHGIGNGTGNGWLTNGKCLYRVESKNVPPMLERGTGMRVLGICSSNMPCV